MEYVLFTVSALFLYAAIPTAIPTVLGDVKISTHDLTLQLQESADFTLKLRNTTTDAKFKWTIQHPDIINVKPKVVSLNECIQKNCTITIKAVGAGHSELVANQSDLPVNLREVYLRVTVQKSAELDILSTIIGWIYFVVWSVPFYPQIYSNFKKKSVEGMNFGLVELDIVGFTLYGIFNLGLYYIPEIKQEYSSRYPRGLNPVQVNDILFANHAAIASLLIIIQCFIYERDHQKVSTKARFVIGVFGMFLSLSIILAATEVMHWLDFLYCCSYVKLIITLLRYVYQAVVNVKIILIILVINFYEKKSTTAAWSMGKIFLDFTGGTLSMLQMILNAHNYDDWASLYGDFPKFGLGLFSVVFNIIFIVQYYIVHRCTNYNES